MNRLPNWYSRLFNLISEKENEQFKIGTNDCTIFAADVVNAVTGVDYAEKYRGKYKTFKAGNELLKADGFESNIDFIEKNFEEIPASFSRAGDIGLIKVKRGFAVVAIMSGFAVAVSNNGLQRYKISEVSKVFKIGN